MTSLAEQITTVGPANYIFTECELARLLGGGDARRYGLANIAPKDVSLLRVKRGINLVGSHYRSKIVNPSAIAQSSVLGS